MGSAEALDHFVASSEVRMGRVDGKRALSVLKELSGA
jgi:hypothetical protein